MEGQTPAFDVRTGADEITWSTSDFWGGLAGSGTKSVSGDEVRLEIPTKHTGYYKLQIRTPDDTVEEAAFAVVPKADRSAPEDFTFGMQTLFGQVWDLQIMDLLKPIGVESIRDSQPWERIEQEKGTYDFDAAKGRYEEYMAKLEQDGIAPLTNFGLVNDNYDDGATPWSTEGQQGYADFVAAVLEHYQDQIDNMVVYNEPNLPKFGDAGDGPANAMAKNYFRLLRRTHKAAKEARPGVTIAGPEIAAAQQNMKSWQPWLDELFELGGLKYMDAISLHPYRDKCCEPEGFHKHLGVVQKLLEEHGAPNKPIWVTEQGWTQELVTEQEQADFVVRAYAEAIAAGVQRYHWFAFMDYNQKAFGLIRSGDHPLGAFTPRPSYVAYGVMTAELDGMSYDGRDDAPKGVFSRRFEGSEGNTRIMWNPDGLRNVELATTEPLKVTDMMGRKRTLRPHDGSVSLTLSGDPLYVDGPVDAIRKGTAYGVSAKDTALGEDVPATLTLDNSDGEHGSATFEVDGEKYELTAADGEVAKKDVTVPPGGNIGDRTITAEVSVGKVATGLVSNKVDVLEDVRLRLEPRLPNVAENNGALVVEVRNNSRTTERNIGTVQWEMNSESGTQQADLTVPPRKKREVTIELDEQVGYWERGKAQAEIEISGLPDVKTTVPMGFNPIIPKTLKIDGDASEIADEPGFDLVEHGVVKRTQLEIPWDGPEDQSGQAWLAADDKYFYMAAKIRDDTYCRDGCNNGASRGDSVQLALSRGMPGDTTDFYEYLLVNRDEPSVRRSFAPLDEAVGDIGGVIDIQHDDQSDITTYEVGIPWSSMKQLGRHHDVFSMSVIFNDNDGEGREGWTEWGSGIGRDKDPSEYNPITRTE